MNQSQFTSTDSEVMVYISGIQILIAPHLSRVSPHIYISTMCHLNAGGNQEFLLSIISVLLHAVLKNYKDL